MRIYGVSQSSGVERRLHLEKGGEGIVLMIADHAGNVERERIMLAPDVLLPAVMEKPEEAVTIEGKSPNLGTKKLLLLEVHGNEVLLTVRSESDEGCDVAVGLDDFQDALEKVIS
jgi:hypothetical protein